MAEIHPIVLLAMMGFASVGLGNTLRHVIDWYLLRKYSKKVTAVLHEVVGDVEAQAVFQRKAE